MFRVEIPPCRTHARRWIIDILLHEFLGVDYEIFIGNSGVYTIELEGKKIHCPDIFLSTEKKLWFNEKSLPQEIKQWNTEGYPFSSNITDKIIPVLFGNAPWICFAEKSVELKFDLIGTAFFMLSRYEESVIHQKDSFGRFPSAASLACKHNFLHRPIVNEYLEILWQCMQHLWPELRRKVFSFRNLISCDLDHPYERYTKSLPKLLKRTISDIAKRTEPFLSVKNYLASARSNFGFDKYFQATEWIMDINEQHGNKVVFFLFAESPDCRMDGDYTVSEPKIRSLVKRIFDRGHEIGLHGSFHSFSNPAQLVREAELFRTSLENQGIHQEKIGGRQHYLRWQPPTTARALQQAGMDYDSTLGFADHIGFRCGICYEYPLFDLEAEKALTLKERPLIVMERSAISERYMGLGHTTIALESILALKRACRQFNGDFTLLWHNSHLVTDQDRDFYSSLIS